MKNLSEGAVLSFVEGEQESIEQYFNLLQEGPHNSSVVKADIDWVSFSDQFSQFEITY